jgi:hypothetical protein
VGLGECIGVVEIMGRRRATPMLVSNEINCVLIGVAVHPRAVIYGILRLFCVTLGFITVSPSPLTAVAHH